MGDFPILPKSLDFVSDLPGINFDQIAPFVKFVVIAGFELVLTSFRVLEYLGMCLSGI